MGFVLRQLAPDDMALGERMRERRKLLNLTLNEASAATKIRRRFLEAMENGAYNDLPAPIYTRHLYEIYANALGLDPRVCRERFDAERGTSDFLEAAKLPLQRVSLRRPWGFRKTAQIAAVLLFLFTVIGALGFQAARALTPPSINITSPANQSIVENAELALLGSTTAGSIVFVNGQRVLLDKAGGFVSEVILERGLNIVTLEVKSRYSGTRTQYHTIIFEPKEKTR